MQQKYTTTKAQGAYFNGEWNTPKVDRERTTEGGARFRDDYCHGTKAQIDSWMDEICPKVCEIRAIQFEDGAIAINFPYLGVGATQSEKSATLRRFMDVLGAAGINKWDVLRAAAKWAVRAKFHQSWVVSGDILYLGDSKVMLGRELCEGISVEAQKALHFDLLVTREDIATIS